MINGRRTGGTALKLPSTQHLEISRLVCLGRLRYRRNTDKIYKFLRGLMTIVHVGALARREGHRSREIATAKNRTNFES